MIVTFTAEVSGEPGPGHPEAIRAKRRAEQLAALGRTEGPPAGSPEAFFARQEVTDAD